MTKQGPQKSQVMVGLAIMVSICVGISGDDPATFQRNRNTFLRLALALVHSGPFNPFGLVVIPYRENSFPQVALVNQRVIKLCYDIATTIYFKLVKCVFVKLSELLV